MKMLNKLIAGTILVCCSLVACSSSDSKGCSEVEKEQKEAELSTIQGILTNAQITYQANSTPANCKAYTDAWDDYIDKLAVFVDCLEGPAKSLWETSYNMQVQNRNAFSC